jgi:glycosyltransferase involved in cell wall biosynthesis
MRLAIFTNIPSIHQIPLARALASKLQEDFALICWQPVEEERERLGWKDEFAEEWLIRGWISEQENKKAYQLLRSAQIVVWGYAPHEEIATRIRYGRLTFCYTERIFKRGRWRYFDPRVFKNLYKKFNLNDSQFHHLLAVGPYCADDFRWIRAFRGRMWRWGYFPEVPKTILRHHNDTPVIFWAGRMLDWKRVDLLVRAAAWARKQGAHFLLRLMGYGPEEQRLRPLVAQLRLINVTEFIEPRSPEQVGRAMEQADIFVLPSNQQEGWGAVVNEAMGRGCCVIGSKYAGSVPWLIQDGINGHIFEGNKVQELGRLLLYCIQNPEHTRKMGLSARATMLNLWSPEVAAERFLRLIESIESAKPSPFDDCGPCSPA